MKFGVNSWIWVSPLTTDEIARLAPLAASLGAEWFEVPLEDPALIDAKRAAPMIRDLGLGVSVCAAMGPDRDLIHPDSAIRDNGMAYLRTAIDVRSSLADERRRAALLGGGPHLADDLPTSARVTLTCWSSSLASWRPTRAIAAWCCASSRSTASRPASSTCRNRPSRSSTGWITVLPESARHLPQKHRGVLAGDAIRAAARALRHFHA